MRSFDEAFEAALSCHIGCVPSGTGFLSHANSWQVWEYGTLVKETDIEEEADILFEQYLEKWWS